MSILEKKNLAVVILTIIDKIVDILRPFFKQEVDDNA